MYEGNNNRLNDVRHLDHLVGDGSEIRSDSEALDIIREAVRRTKGKCNNRLAWLLALQRKNSVDDVIEYGSVKINSAYQPLVVRKPERLDEWSRKRVQAHKRIVKIKDTYIRKYLEDKGLWTVDLDSELGDLYTDWKRYVGNDYRAQKLSRVIAFSKYMTKDNRFINECGNTMTHWVETVSLEVVDGKDWTKARKDFFNAELKWLGDAPAVVFERIAGKEQSRTCSLTKAVFNSGLFNHWQDTPTSAELCELAKVFTEVMEHIGLGVADTGGHGHLTLASMRIGVKSLLKKAIGSLNVFTKLVKQGFDPALARAEVIDQLNKYVLASKMRAQWEFYALENAPDKYDYQVKPKSSGSGTPRKRRLDGVDAEGFMDIPGVGKLKV